MHDCLSLCGPVIDWRPAQSLPHMLHPHPPPQTIIGLSQYRIWIDGLLIFFSIFHTTPLLPVWGWRMDMCLIRCSSQILDLPIHFYNDWLTSMLMHIYSQPHCKVFNSKVQEGFWNYSSLHFLLTCLETRRKWLLDINRESSLWCFGRPLTVFRCLCLILSTSS